MSKKLIYLIPFILVLSLVLTSTANAADPNLVGWWRFNEGAGTATIDSSGNNLNGELVNDPLWVAGVQGTALQFSAGSHVAVPGYEGILGTHARTSTAWINVTKTSASIITWGPSGSGTKWVMRTHNDPATLRLECGRGNTYGTTDLMDGEWHHVAVVLIDDGSPDVSELKLYVDGKLDPIMTGGTPNQMNTSSGGEFRIAYDLNNTGRTYDGMIDDVRIYDRALSADDIQALMDDPGGTVTQALGPDPADGALLEDTWANLKWSPGDLALSHDVYFGDNFDDVNDGTENTFQGNQSGTSLIVGFPGFAYPDGLVPGTTYYWRIDEVNETEPNSPWKSSIWSFQIQPKIAWNPVPTNGAKFVDPNASLSWDPGVGALMHYVYFGDNFEDVNGAEGGAFVIGTTYDLGPLEMDKTYYWRVDSSDGANLHRGNVWSFTTTVPGGGLIGEYFNNMNLIGQPILTRTDPMIDVDYGGNSPANAVNPDGFSVRWRGELQAVFSEVYTFYTRTNDGSRLWIDEQLIVDKWAWVNRVVDTRSEPIRLVAGERYSIRMEWFNEDGDSEAHLLWESASEPKAIIPSAAYSLPVRAVNPNPSNGAVDVKLTPILSWIAGEAAVSHQVYFGTDEEAVKNANTGSPEYKGTKTLGSESYNPGKLAWHSPCYWRVDEVNDINPDSPWVGNVWSFTTADFIGIDDFEDYNDWEPDRIFDTWIDGWGVETNGSEVGYAEPNFPDGEHHVETTIVHGGSQSMPYFYENNFKYSEATMTLVSVRDWTEEGVGVLSLWFYGNASNAAERMYVALNGTAVVYHDNPDAALIDTWTEWTVDLQEFAAQGVNLANVNTISIGFGDKNNLQAGGSGMVLFDDIRLYRPAPEPEPAP